MTPKQNWYCFWLIIIVSVILLAAFVWFAIHNPQASFYTIISNIWESIANT